MEYILSDKGLQTEPCDGMIIKTVEGNIGIIKYDEIYFCGSICTLPLNCITEIIAIEGYYPPLWHAVDLHDYSYLFLTKPKINHDGIYVDRKFHCIEMSKINIYDRTSEDGPCLYFEKKDNLDGDN